MSVAGERLLVARVETGLLAYRDACKACGASLEDAELSEGVLVLHLVRARVLPARAPGARSTATGSSSTRCRSSPTRASGARVALPS